MVVGTLVALGAALAAAVAVGDDRHSGSSSRGVNGCREIAEAGAGRLHEQDMAARAHRADHVEVERLFLVPTGVHARIIPLDAALIDLLEAAVGGRARRESVRGTIICE